MAIIIFPNMVNIIPKTVISPKKNKNNNPQDKYQADLLLSPSLSFEFGLNS